MRMPIEQLNAFVPDGVDARYYLRRVRCMKTYCRICPRYGGHGPYWYASWHVATGKRRQFMGRRRPAGISDEDAEQAIARFMKRQRRRGRPTDVPEETWWRR